MSGTKRNRSTFTVESIDSGVDDRFDEEIVDGGIGGALIEDVI